MDLLEEKKVVVIGFVKEPMEGNEKFVDFIKRLRIKYERKLGTKEILLKVM